MKRIQQMVIGEAVVKQLVVKYLEEKGFRLISMQPLHPILEFGEIGMQMSNWEGYSVSVEETDAQALARMLAEKSARVPALPAGDGGPAHA